MDEIDVPTAFVLTIAIVLFIYICLQLTKNRRRSSVDVYECPVTIIERVIPGEPVPVFIFVPVDKSGNLITDGSSDKSPDQSSESGQPSPPSDQPSVQPSPPVTPSDHPSVTPSPSVNPSDQPSVTPSPPVTPSDQPFVQPDIHSVSMFRKNFYRPF